MDIKAIYGRDPASLNCSSALASLQSLNCSSAFASLQSGSTLAEFKAAVAKLPRNELASAMRAAGVYGEVDRLRGRNPAIDHPTFDQLVLPLYSIDQLRFSSPQERDRQRQRDRDQMVALHDLGWVQRENNERELQRQQAQHDRKQRELVDLIVQQVLDGLQQGANHKVQTVAPHKARPPQNDPPAWAQEWQRTYLPLQRIFSGALDLKKFGTGREDDIAVVKNGRVTCKFSAYQVIQVMELAGKGLSVGRSPETIAKALRKVYPTFDFHNKRPRSELVETLLECFEAGLEKNLAGDCPADLLALLPFLNGNGEVANGRGSTV